MNVCFMGNRDFVLLGAIYYITAYVPSPTAGAAYDTDIRVCTFFEGACARKSVIWTMIWFLSW